MPALRMYWDAHRPTTCWVIGVRGATTRRKKGRAEETQGVVPPALGGAAVDRLQHPADLVPGNGPGNVGETILLRPLDGVAQIAGDNSLPVEGAKKHPKGAAQRWEGGH